MMDYYNTLGVPRDADQETIKKAYRKLAMQHHPDKGGDPNEFQKINEAYEILGDTDRRFQYDHPQTRSQGFPGGFNFNVNGFDIDDLFGQVFGRRGNPFAQQQNLYRTRITVSLLDSYNGVQQVLQLNTPSGTKVITIMVPKGVMSGDQVRYDNVIENGMLIIEFVVLSDLKYDRRGDDLYANLSISVLDLIVGTKIDFTTLSGKQLEVVINPKTQPYQQVKLAGHGMPIKDTSFYGDQILLLKPFIPDNISQDVIDSILRNQSK